jgi:hypothetical protein
LKSKIETKEEQSLLESLGKELLEKYKEINLLYNIGEKVSADNSLNDIGKIFLSEIFKIVKFDYASFYFNLDEIASLCPYGEITVFKKKDLKNIKNIISGIIENGNGLIENMMFFEDKKSIFNNIL